MSDQILAQNAVGSNSGLLAPVATPRQWAERRALFNSWVNDQLKQDIDFGQIPNTDKPTLYKPGAEKILQFYGCAPRISCTNRVADPGTGYLTVEYSAEAVSIQTGIVVGQGVGMCSSYESKYRYRKEWWNMAGQPMPAQNWERTKGGKYFRRIDNPDLIDVWNTVIKMAKKRALVDLALTISGASEKFTQDLEDSYLETGPAEETRGTPPPPASTTTPPTDGKPMPHWIDDASARNRFWGDCTKMTLTNITVHDILGVKHMNEFAGTREEAMAKLAAWLSQKTEAK